MRIAMVIGAYHSRGGLERVAVETSLGLADRGHQVVVVTQTTNGESIDPRIDVMRVGGLRRTLWGRTATFPTAATKAVKDLNVDVVYSFGSSVTVPAVVRTPGAHKSWWELANREWPATSLEGFRRRLNPHHRLTLGMDSLVLGRGKPLAVLAAGDWAAEDIKRFYPSVSDRVHVLPDGVNLESFSFDAKGRDSLREAWKIGDGPVLLTVATELRRKGLDTLCEAFKLVRAKIPEAVLVIGGRAPITDIRALAVAHGLSDGVRAIGEIEDMRAAYSAADALMFPTRFDPWGLPVIEALACGTPVAVSGRAGAAGAIVPGMNGSKIYDPSKASQVAAATVEALFCDAPRSEIRETVYHLAWPRVVEQLEEHLTRVAGSR